jgi:hypothetical protein
MPEAIGARGAWGAGVRGTAPGWALSVAGPGEARWRGCGGVANDLDQKVARYLFRRPFEYAKMHKRHDA